MGEEGRVFKLFCQPRFLGKSGVQQVCTWLSPDVVLVKRLYQAGLGNWTASSAVVGDCEWKPWHYGSAFSVVLWAVAQIGFNLWKHLSMHVRFHLFIWITVSTAAVAHTWSAQVRGLGRELFEFPYVCATARTKKDGFVEILISGHSRAGSHFSRQRIIIVCFGERWAEAEHSVYSPEHGRASRCAWMLCGQSDPSALTPFSKKFGKDLIPQVLERCSSTSSTACSSDFGKGKGGGVSKDFAVS